MAKPNLFNAIKLSKPNRNVFDLTHDVKLSLDFGKLVPICIQEAVPGDKFHISCESLLRFAPLVSPVMHRMDVSMHYFFVPNRIIWPDWEKWIVNDNTTPLSFPTLTFGGDTIDQRLGDYLGIPDFGAGTNLDISALPFAAYQAIYNEYYRDQNLVDPVDYKLISGDNTTNPDLTVLRNRAYEHDYFTAALPFAQKGDAVSVPFGDSVVKLNTTDSIAGVEWKADDIPGGADRQILAQKGNASFGAIPDDTLYADNTTATPNINDLRRAFRLQEWLERNARAGTRYVENILVHFGVKSSDARLNRPEYITGIKSPVTISEVLNTSGEVDGLPQGNMAGHAVGVTSGNYGKYFCEEHGYIIGVMSVMPKTAYMQGVPKHFLKYEDPFQYFWPAFANIGEQEVKNIELYATAGAVDQFETFGYVPRYAEYKYAPSRVAGDFRTTLEHWHLARKFATQPALNKAFIECTPEANERIFAVVDPTEQKMYCHVLNKIKAVRPMPKFGNPSF